MVPRDEHIDIALREHIDYLNAAILTLLPTREKGFEGLVRETLCEITGVPFRLAGSGSQYGIDGRAAFDADAVGFECKLYFRPLNKDAVLARISEAAIEDPDMEIWVLGATVPVHTQLANLVRRRGKQDGISVLILDWSDAGLPLLAVALAMGGTRVRDFLKAHLPNTTDFQRAQTALEVVRCCKDFSSHAVRIRGECDAASVGLALARKENTALLSDVFSSRAKAKLRFGQPLAPADLDNVTIRQRRALIDQLHSHITATPDKTVAFVLGEEGCGKSWLVAQSWLDLEQKPLMLFIPLSQFENPGWEGGVCDLLINVLIDQTGDRHDVRTIQRWVRRFEQWRNHPPTDGSRLIVVLDGINQRSGLNWARIIARISDEVFQLGGCVIVTDRTSDFRYRVEPRLDASVTAVEIPVPEWTKSERDEILATSGIKPTALHPSVSAELRNPRLLGIALELLSADEISTLEELTVSRLLFEHIRKSAQYASEQPLATEIAFKLQEHAQQIMSRIEDGKEDDLLVFRDIQAVADGRFFVQVDGDPTRYSFKDDGLSLALGFLIIDRLSVASRNGRNLREELGSILEPIETLGDTADLTLAGLTIAAVDTHFGPDEIVTALIEGFASLQNPDQASFAAFAGLAKRRVRSFMDAAQALCLSGRYQPNFDWVQEAVIEASRDGHCWPAMADRVHSWLSVYSLSPERGILRLSMPDQQQKVQDQLEKNRTAIHQKVQSLSDTERGILESMTEAEGDLSRLSQLALLLLAGKPLAPFTQSFVNWSFSAAMNSDHATPYKEFRYLVSLNRIDWAQTRKSLLSESTLLRAEDVSSTGKWALVTILRATGHSDDGEEAEFLVENLTKGGPRPESWRRIETYCASDPCDPASEKPDNVAHTVKQYGEIDVSKLHIAMGPTSEDHFWNMARPGMARFEPKAAVAKHRELVTNVLHRTGFSLRQGLFELRKHAALLSIEDAQELVKRRTELRTTNATADLSKEDVWIVSQYHLLLAFPLLSAKEQAAILLASEKNEKFLLDLFRIAKPLSEKAFESLLKAACSDDDERGQFLLLQLGYYTSVPLSRGARKHIATLIRSKSDRVRTFALGVIAQSGDEELLNKVVESNWMATDAKMKTYWEAWFGSMALLEAASQGLIAHENAVDRISPRLYGRAAVMLDADAVYEIARRIDISITHVAGLGSDLVAPHIELQVDSSSPCEPNQFTVNERVSEVEILAQGMYRGLNDEEFMQSQSRAHDAFLRFETNLTQAGARIILDNLTLDGFAAVVAAAPDLADQWYELFMSIADNKLPAVHNLILWLANALAKKDAERAKKLFARVKGSNPFVRPTYWRAGVPLDAMSTWYGARNPVLEDVCFARLDRASNDHELSLEVLAALLSDQDEALIAYIEKKLRKQEPAEVARGIMVAGFSDACEFNDRVLAKYKGCAGLIGDAQRVAKYAYERNVWARQWFEMMCQTDDREDFWRYSVLFSKIVDGKFDAWRTGYTQKGAAIQSYGFSLDDAIKNRIARWETHRSKTLFGLDAPASIFLQGVDINN